MIDLNAGNLLAFATAAVLVVLGTWLFKSNFTKSTLPSQEITNTKEDTRLKLRNSKNTEERIEGVWEPVAFDFPSIEPFTDELANIKPIPYRPFRWGDYHLTMGIRDMPWNQWLELDNLFFEYRRIKEHRIRTRGTKVIHTLPANDYVGSGLPGAVEFVHELAEYLSRKYPKMYRVTRHRPGEGTAKDQYGWYGESQIKEITIVPLDITYDLDTEDPMTVAALLVQEDLAIMVEGSDGRYYLQAGATCIPGFWRLEDKIGLALDEIHIKSHVPQFESKLDKSMARFFKRLPVDKPVTRNNFFFQALEPESTGGPRSCREFDPQELAWSETMHGDEDLLGESTGGVASPTVTPSTLYLRSERQTLRRLPRTGAVAFTIRVYLTPLDALVSEPGIPGRMASAIRSWPEDVATYHSRPKYESILKYLDRSHADQIKAGVIKEDERGNSAHPF